MQINNKPGRNLHQVKWNDNRCTAAEDKIVNDKGHVHEVRQKYWLSVIWMGPGVETVYETFWFCKSVSIKFSYSNRRTSVIRDMKI